MASGITVIIDPEQSGTQNMMVDLELFERYREGIGGPVLRIYDWNEPTVSIGRFQDRAQMQMQIAASAPAQLPIVRRPTGGRAVLHLPGELTYAVVGGTRSGFPSSLKEIYSEISSVLIDALQSLDICVHVGGSAANHSDDLCFSSGTRADIMCGSNKIAGSAQLRDAGAFLQHGSIVVRHDFHMHEMVFGSAAARRISASGVCGIAPSVSRKRLLGAVVRAASSRWP